MRGPRFTTCTATEPNPQDAPTIPSNADLSITMTTQSKPKRRTKKYRAIERPDGIIVESPRYRPAAASQKPTTELEGKPVSTNHNGTQRKHATQGASSNSMEHDLMGIGMSVCVVSIDDTDSDGNTRLLGRGRAGYNEETARKHTPMHVDVKGVKQQSHRECVPMARFLGEPGPWGPFSPREGSYTALASLVEKDNAAGSDSMLR